MKRFTTKFKQKLSSLPSAGPVFSAAAGLLDGLKFTIAWLLEFVAIASSAVLIVIALINFTEYQPLAGLLAIVGAMLLMGVCWLINIVTQTTPQKNEKR